jgi:hypothetical protein
MSGVAQSWMPVRWDGVDQLRTRAEVLKREFEAAEAPEKKRAAQLRWQEAVNEFTDALLKPKPTASE